ncbi:ketopantoate reductase family protein [bacterium]|nr:ketopantoate reductase family protein [bacterium]
MKRVVLCGLGAVGMAFGVRLNDCDEIDFRVAVDKKRLEKYAKNKPCLNGIEQIFNFILPETDDYKADLVIISTKFDGLIEAMETVKNFVTENTRIISLINGISSEKIIKKRFPKTKVLKSYFIGHSAVRNGNNVTHDGTGKIVTENDIVLKEIFEKSKIEYKFKEDMDYELWKKFTFNVFSNQISAIFRMNFGELKSNKEFIPLAKKIINEIKPIALKEGIKNLENLERDAINSLNEMCDEGKTSMLQDILAGRKTEVDIFSGEIINLGKLYEIPTPYNQVLYDLIKFEEGKNEYSIHSGKRRK